MRNVYILSKAIQRLKTVAGVVVFTIFVPSSVALAQSNQAPIAAKAELTKAAQVKPSIVRQTAVPVEKSGPVEMGPPLSLVVGKSTLLRLPQSIERISIGNPAITDVTLISSRELYLIGKTFGSTNVMLWHQGGGTTVLDVLVQIDTASLQEQLRRLLPSEQRIEIRSAAESIVLTGTVSSAIKATEAIDIAEGFIRAYTRSLNLPSASSNASETPSGVKGGPGNSASARPASASAPAAQSAGTPKVISLLKIDQPMQVMIDVKVAEVSRTLIDKLGVSVKASRTNGDWSWSVLSALQSATPLALGATKANGQGIVFDAQKQDGVLKVLAEPSLIAISGQEASFLAGGKIFIPVAQENKNGGTTITLEEKEYGVSLRFLPTVLERGQISLRIAPEVSELNQSGNPFASVNGVTTVLPGFTTRRANTQVILGDGQSIAIAGLIRNNVTETVKKVPGLGELPILGSLFRSTEFQNDRSELLIVITARLVKALDQEPALPTDSFKPASRGQIYGAGNLEGSGHQDVPEDRKSQPKLELK
jgi:pilus assembly protein CpaC